LCDFIELCKPCSFTWRSCFCFVRFASEDHLLIDDLSLSSLDLVLSQRYLALSTTNLSLNLAFYERKPRSFQQIRLNSQPHFVFYAALLKVTLVSLLEINDLSLSSLDLVLSQGYLALSTKNLSLNLAFYERKTRSFQFHYFPKQKHSMHLKIAQTVFSTKSIFCILYNPLKKTPP